MSYFLRSEGPITAIIITDTIQTTALTTHNNFTTSLVVLEEMFRETLQALACLSVLASTYSLHMSSRDSYRNPLNGISLVQLNDETQQQQQHEQEKLHDPTHQTKRANSIQQNTNHNKMDVVSSYEENDIPEYGNLNQPIGPLMQPRGLQELFGTPMKYDIRTQQNQQDTDITSNQHQSKRSGIGPSGGNSKMISNLPHGIASQLMLRSARGQRQYDVPQIGKL